jgi:hypothetical protein
MSARNASVLPPGTRNPTTLVLVGFRRVLVHAAQGKTRVEIIIDND